MECFTSMFSHLLLRVSLSAAICLFGVLSIECGWWAVRSASRRIRRVGGIVLLSFLGLWLLAMTVSGSYRTQEEKEQMRAAQSEVAASRAVLGGLLVAADAPRMLRGDIPMQSVLAWEHGVYEDGVRIVFPEGWVFPHGSNHLSSVEVMAWGEILSDGYSENAIASLGPRLSLVPGVSSFRYGMSPSNSCVFSWMNARDGRVNGESFDGRIELSRNGDVSITTNGVAAHLPRELPFPHDGFGQDDEWVSANFTNATEILAVGYPQWVDSQVGTGLTNGLYKLTINVADDPPETTLVSVGNLSIAVTNAGEYVFLLGKGIRYDLSASSECATNFVYSALDDIVCHTRLAAGGLRQQRDGGQEGVWSSDSGELRLFWPFEFVEWKPTLSISPQKWNPSRANAVRSFTATLTDIPWFVSPSYTWSSADSSVCTCDGASDRTATFTCKFPAAYGSGVSLALDVMLNRTTLHADYWRYIGYFSESEDYEESIDDCDDCEPNPGLVVCASPSVVFFERGTANATSAEVGCYYQMSEAGTFELTVSGDVVSVTDQAGASVSSGYTWETDGGVVGARHFFAERSAKSTSPSGTVFTVTFTPDAGTNTLSGTGSLTFVEWETETVETWPSDRRRKELGVGEMVHVSFDPGIVFSSFASSIPPGVVIPSGIGAFRYTAPTNACVDVVSFVSASGCICSIPFSILEPTGNIVVNLSSNLVNSLNVAGTFEMYFDLVIAPTNVSFKDRIEVAEIGMVSTNAIGYFSNPALLNLLNHSLHGANIWVDVKANNRAGSDTVCPGALHPPFSDGSFTWPIPNHWRMKGNSGSGKWFCNDDQHFAITSNGTTSVWKFGKKGVRMLNSNILTITDEAIP